MPTRLTQGSMFGRLGEAPAEPVNVGVKAITADDWKLELGIALATGKHWQVTVGVFKGVQRAANAYNKANALFAKAPQLCVDGQIGTRTVDAVRVAIAHLKRQNVPTGDAARVSSILSPTGVANLANTAEHYAAQLAYFAGTAVDLRWDRVGADREKCPSSRTPYSDAPDAFPKIIDRKTGLSWWWYVLIAGGSYAVYRGVKKRSLGG